MRLKPKQKRKRSARRDLLVMLWRKDMGTLAHVSLCHTEKGAVMSQRHAEKLFGYARGLYEVQIADAQVIRSLGCATTRDTEVAELEAMFLKPLEPSQ